MAVLRRRKTYPSNCRDCGQRIFVHSNGYGDTVLFDDLGQPWPIHYCYLNRRRRSDIGFTKSIPSAAPGGFDVMGQSIRRVGPKKNPRRIATASGPPMVPMEMKTPGEQPSATPPPQPERPRNIRRCEPAHYLDIEVIITGYVSGKPIRRSVEYYAAPGTVGHSLYRQIIGSDDFSQVTVITGDLWSYTVLAPVLDETLGAGALVSMGIRGVKTPARAVFICEWLDEIEFK